ncbi:MAG: aminopeptidase, partial [Halobacteriaceae archaeon]
KVTFDIPMRIDGVRVNDVYLEFDDGEVTEWSASTGSDAIQEVLETDDGARKVGELGIGMNRGIDRGTGNILFDEKMGGTIHLALGRAYDACLPSGETGNQSATHTDLITRMDDDSRMEVDGEIVQQGGVFRWEDEFQGSRR